MSDLTPSPILDAVAQDAAEALHRRLRRLRWRVWRLLHPQRLRQGLLVEQRRQYEDLNTDSDRSCCPPGEGFMCPVCPPAEGGGAL